MPVESRDDMVKRLERLARIARKALDTGKIMSVWSADADTLDRAAKRIAELEAERDRLRRKLSLYADATEIHGMSWNGFNLIGDEKSIKELRRIENRSSQLEQYTAEYENRIASLQRALAEETERHQWRTIDSAPKDRVIFVRRDNGCGTDYEIVWWNDHRSDGYPWRSEFNAYSENRWDEWFDATAIRSGKPDGKE